MKQHDNPSAAARQSGESTRQRNRPSGAETRVEPQPERVSSAVSEHLNRLLSDEFVLYVRTLNCHWNVSGMQFRSLHEFFEELYKETFEVVDDVAERIRTVGDSALGSLQGYLEHAQLKESTAAPTADPRSMIEHLAEGYEQVIRGLRDGIRLSGEEADDPATENLLTDILEKQEKTLWMLKSHLDRDLR